MSNLQQSQNGGAFTNVASWDNLNAQNTYVTRSWNRTPVNGSSFRYRLLAYDYAGNYGYSSASPEIRFDTIRPTTSIVYKKSDGLNYIP